MLGGAALLLASVAACSSSNDMNGGTAAGAGGSSAGSSAAAGAGGGSTATAATFTQVLGILKTHNCAICHASPAGTINGGFQFNPNDATAAYTAFVGKMSAGTGGSKCGGKTYVTKGSPNDSLLYQKLAASPPCGDRMPLSMAPLSQTELASVASWIMAGASNN